MCGILGTINFEKREINKKIIPSLISSIKHRGPDNSDFWLLKSLTYF